MLNTHADISLPQSVYPVLSVAIIIVFGFKSLLCLKYFQETWQRYAQHKPPYRTRLFFPGVLCLCISVLNFVKVTSAKEGYVFGLDCWFVCL